ncbi:MAG: cell division ATP-binding protein FtsE [Ruminococcus sp.]|uniref:cell division ATP-binding protein FtsE n=1 Tax=Ruminococcus sp. TaxID=41978 RepID=UPI001B3F7AE5|nr:cell division ATP-binding protein FtsE [Ruminococcus sp.]
MVELKNVSVTYSSGVDALNNVSLKINDGDFAFVVGSSGAGKSTMIKLLLKEIDATSGVVTVNGYNLNKLKKRKIPEFRRTLGFVFQDFRLIPSMTVYENIAFVLRVIDAPIKYIRKRVPYVISLVGLHAKTNSYPDELSGGEKQRVAIARALVNDPQLIIADEPTGNIDPELSYEIVELLKGINDQGTTILMVTHEHDLVRHFGGRIINITEGEIVFDEVITGTGDELLADMSAEMPAEAMAEAVSETEQISDITGTESSPEAAELPIEDMTADDIITAIGGIPEPEQAEKELMKPVAENIDVDITQELPKIPEGETPEQILASLSDKTEGGAE